MRFLTFFPWVLFLMPLDNIIRQTERPFTIHEKSQFISKSEIKKAVKGTGNSIQIEVSNISGGTGTFRGEILPPAEISSIDVLRGSYPQKTNVVKNGRGQKIQLNEVIYPFRARFTINGELFDVEITEPGSWKINLVLMQ